ncbi:MAG: hypothetical protein LH609_01600 [Rudanella sp.]|nr:hypothetical protein [Rudanella sp.]
MNQHFGDKPAAPIVGSRKNTAIQNAKRVFCIESASIGELATILNLFVMIQINKRSVASIGVIFFLIPVLFFALWIHACNQTSGYPENVELYQSYLPSVLKGRFTTTVLSLVLCVLAIGLNMGSLNSSNKFLKTVSWFTVIAGGLLGFLNLFSIM